MIYQKPKLVEKYMTELISTKIPDLTLRFAKEMDCELILGLIKGLAEYEKLSHEVVTNADTLRESLFNGRQVAEVVIAEYDGISVGFALFFHNFSTFLGKPGLYLEDLFVKPEYRGKGVGQVLLAFLGKLAKERNCGRLEWAVLDWNEPAIKFYQMLGAGPLDEWTVYRIAGKGLDELSNQF